jgi:hypothetical protein
VKRPGTLIIGTFGSTCGGCGRGADPYEPTHHTIRCYGPDNGAEGCGAVWSKVTSNYSDSAGLHDRIRKMRPDLEYEPLGGAW